MKKIVSFVLLLFVVGLIFAEEYTVSSYEYYDSYGIKKDMDVRINDETNRYMFYLNNGSYSICMKFKEEDLKSMRQTAQKALEWQEVARKNEADVSKEIPDSKLYMSLEKNTRSHYYRGKNKVQVLFQFVSAKKSKEMGLLIVGGKTSAVSNEYIDIEFEGQIISDINSFADAISEKTISEAIKEHNESLDKAKDLFI